jgi:lactate permease
VTPTVPAWQGWLPWLIVVATGSAVLAACLVTGVLFRLSPAAFWGCLTQTLHQAWLAVITVMLVVSLAYLMNYAGLAYTLGKGAASTGHLFVLFSPFLGWVAVALSGSDTAGNALFGNLQVVAARQLDLSPVLFAATNSSGGVMGKMISPQNIATGAAVTQLKGQEGTIFGRTFVHSIVLTLVLVALVLAQQYLFPGIIPGVSGTH